MRSVSLPNSNRETTQLGFGCAFWPAVTEQMALRMLEAAYDAGIRHFDTAPYYLDGRSEHYVGQFLESHPDCTVTTKYGLLPLSARPLHIKVARAVLGPLVRRLRKLKKPSQQTSTSAGVGSKASYGVDDARRSLEKSLQRLRRTSVDLFLTHEPETDDLDRAGFLEFLQQQVESRRIGAIGVGGEFERAAAAHASKPGLFDVMQYNWDALDQRSIPAKFQVHYWVFSSDFSALHASLSQDKHAAGIWSDSIGVDVTDAGVLRAVMLKAALLANPNGIVLVHSSKAENIYRNVEVASEDRLVSEARRLLELGASQSLPRPARSPANQESAQTS